MAVKTEIWVRAYLRRCFAAGLTGVVARHGADEAGAVFVKVTQSAKSVLLFGPAPGPAYDAAGQRRWARPLGAEAVQPDTVDRFLERQVSFDPDLWILDIDDARGAGLIEVSEAREDDG